MGEQGVKRLQATIHPARPASPGQAKTIKLPAGKKARRSLRAGQAKLELPCMYVTLWCFTVTLDPYGLFGFVGFLNKAAKKLITTLLSAAKGKIRTAHVCTAGVSCLVRLLCKTRCL